MALWIRLSLREKGRWAITAITLVGSEKQVVEIF